MNMNLRKGQSHYKRNIRERCTKWEPREDKIEERKKTIINVFRDKENRFETFELLLRSDDA